MFPGNERRFSERSSLRVLSQVRDIQPVDSMSVTFEYTPTNRNSPGYIFLLKNAVGEGAFNLTYAFQNGTGAISFAEDGKKILTTTSFPVDETTRRLPVSVKLYVDGDSAVVSIGRHTDHLHDIGLMFQINLLSLAGAYKGPERKIARDLIKRRLVDFVGTDLHGRRHVESIRGYMATREFRRHRSALEKVIKNGLIPDN